MSHWCLGLCGLDLASNVWIVGLVVTLGKRRDVSYTVYISLGRLQVPVENHDCICVAFCICGFACK